MLRTLNKFVVGPAISQTFAVAASAQASWTGVYFGGNVGGALGRSTANTSISSDMPAIATTGRQHLSPNGITAGGQGGMNFQSGSLVFGGEADFGLMKLDAEAIGTTCCDPLSFTIFQSIETDWLLTARGRVGHSAGNALIYVTGGLAVTGLNYHAVFVNNNPRGFEIGNVNKNKTGWAGGGGMEYKISARLAVKGEYLYSDFGRVTTTSTPSNIFTNPAAMHAHIVRGGINYRW